MGVLSDIIIVFWDMKSNGSKNMIKIGNKLEKPVFVIDITKRKILPNFLL